VHQGRPFATHLPLLLRRDRGEHGTLLGHVARANQQRLDLEGGQEALAIFQGDHAYVSPSWYETYPAVPTWNYATVHAYGVPRVIHDDAVVRETLRALVDTYESGSESPWTMDLPEEYLRTMLLGIVAFELPIARLEGKFKLSQNQPVGNQRRVAARLADSPDAAERRLAGTMREILCI
jgi:transcriptional regulator